MRFFKVILSNKTEVIIDEEDYKKVTYGMQSGSFVKVKKAIINPSFIQNVVAISQQEALQHEIKQETIEGYIDEEKKAYVVTKRVQGLIPTSLKDEMS